MNSYVGLDIGSNGAISIIDSGLTLKASFKLHKDADKASEIILKALVRLAKEDRYSKIIIGYEDVHSIFQSSKKSNFTFGFNKGLVAGVVHAFKLSYPAMDIIIEKVHAKVWQNKTWLDTDKVYGNNGMARKLDTKATSLNAANRIFRGESFRATARSTTPHDGIIDATLLAYHLLNKYEPTL